MTGFTWKCVFWAGLIKDKSILVCYLHISCIRSACQHARRCSVCSWSRVLSASLHSPAWMRLETSVFVLNRPVWRDLTDSPKWTSVVNKYYRYNLKWHVCLLECSCSKLTVKLDAAVTSPVFATNMAADSTCFVSMRQPSNNFGNGFIFICNKLPQKVFIRAVVHSQLCCWTLSPLTTA